MSLHLGFGLLSAQRIDGSNQPWTELYDDLVALVVAAEAAGRETAWVTEHHFTTDGYMSACLPVLAAVAARTERIRLGTNVLLAPLHHPLRLAEDAAAVGVLSHGRLILGIGIGYRDEEFAAIGVAKRDRVPLIEETVATCRAAWIGEPFTFRGQNILLRPTPPPGQPVWIGAWVPEGIRRAGRIADGFISPAGGLGALINQAQVLDDAAEAAGRVAPLPICAPVSVYLSDDGRVSEAVARGAAHLNRHYGQWYSSSSDAGGGREVGDRILAQAEDPTAGILCGSAQRVIDSLAPQIERFAREREFHLVIRHHWPGMGRAETLDQLGYFSSEVAPHLASMP